MSTQFLSLIDSEGDTMHTFFILSRLFSIIGNLFFFNASFGLIFIQIPLRFSEHRYDTSRRLLHQTAQTATCIGGGFVIQPLLFSNFICLLLRQLNTDGMSSNQFPAFSKCFVWLVISSTATCGMQSMSMMSEEDGGSERCNLSTY